MKEESINIVVFPNLNDAVLGAIQARAAAEGIEVSFVQPKTQHELEKVMTKQDIRCCLISDKSELFLPESVIKMLRENSFTKDIFVVAGNVTPAEMRNYNRAGATEVFLENESDEIAGKVVSGLLHKETALQSASLSDQGNAMMLQWLINSAGESMLLLNPEGVVLMANEYAARRLNTSVDLLLGQSVYLFLPDAVAETRRQMLRKAVDTRMPLKFEDKRNGLWVLHHLHPVMEHDKVVAVAIYAIDISEKRIASEALAESELRLRLALDASMLGLYDLNVVTGEAKVNNRYAEMIGYDYVDFHETNDAWIERLHPDDREPVGQAYKNYVSGKTKDYVVEFRQKHRLGHWVWILSLGKIMERNESGEPLRMLGTHLDITEKKANEIRISNELALRKLLFEVSNDGIVMINDAHMVLEANDRFCDMLGYTMKELQHMHTWDFDAMMDEQTVKKDFHRDVLVNSRFESVHRRKDGSCYDVEVSAKSFEWNEQWFVLCVCRDISERKLAESRIGEKISELESSRAEALNLASILSEKVVELQLANTLVQRNEEQIKLIYDHSPMGLLSFDDHGIITACNDRFVEIIGSSREALIGLDMTRLPDKQVVKLINNALAGISGIYSGTYNSVTADKQTEVRIQFAPVVNNTGVVTGGVGIVEDISEEAASARHRHELEQRFAKTFYSSPVAMAITDKPTGEFIDVNEEYCRLSGYDRSQIIGQTVTGLGIIEEEGRENIIKSLERLGYINQEEVILNMRNHEQRIILISFEQYEVAGRTYLLSTLIDITERKQYEAELAKLTRAVEQSPVSIVITDLDGDIEYVNPRVAETTGYLPSELIGKNPRVLSSGEMPYEEYKKMYQTISQGNTWQGEFHNRRKSGELYWESATISPVINDEGVMTHYIAVKEDITDRKRMQAELVESEQLYRSIFMGNPVPMWIYDVETLKFVAVNDQAVNDYGYSREEFAVMTLKDIRPPEDHEPLMNDVRSNLEKSQGPVMWRHIKKDGSQIDVEISSHALPAAGGFNQRMVMAYNVTDRQKAKRELEKAIAMAEASDKLKTAFLNNISHEVRTPLNGILGAVNILNEPDISREDLAEMLEIINESTERLIRTITDYMDISLINSDNLECRMKKVILAPILRQVAGNFEWSATRKNLRLMLDMPPETNAMVVETDTELFSKALYQIVHNAIKYTNQGEVIVGLKAETGKLVAFVRDTGIGISTDAINRVFEPFNQEDMSASRRYEGSGLGLAIVSGIMNKLGGTVRAESEKGVGSVFYLELPLFRDTFFPEPAPVPLKEQHEVTNVTVLIAEDEDSNYAVLELLLRQMSTAKLIRARNGQEAVQTALSDPSICLILMDIKMPVMDGLEATRQIKSQKPEINIVAITAYAMSGDEHKALSAGCNDYIAKPVALKTLKQKIESYGVPLKTTSKPQS